MKTPTLYVIMDVSGRTHVVTGGAKEPVDFNQLLDEGWRPVSETCFGQSASVLIRMEREHEGQLGFGFGK
jgi:hypothetical protein